MTLTIRKPKYTDYASICTHYSIYFGTMYTYGWPDGFWLFLLVVAIFLAPAFMAAGLMYLKSDFLVDKQT